MARKKVAGPHATDGSNNNMTVVAKGPSGPGALAGYEATCGVCGYTIGSTVEFNATMDMRKHISYMAKEGK